ncbi:hypothetical protein TSAR_002102 [Trichomalopsis sarcophagae]|uniref:Uncharacterized protein n=1 Tax=Trichomalopsis sarcophagae TaxID=543379 RepID=A0A232EPI4_9HYME|nr:hypothetical protein TSAR_002102 [Trichomalopsis sarcophagae]
MSYEQAREKVLEEELELEGQRVFNQAIEEFDMEEEEEVRRRHQRNLQKRWEKERVTESVSQSENQRGERKWFFDGTKPTDRSSESRAKRTWRSKRGQGGRRESVARVPSPRESIAYRNILSEYRKAVGDKLIDSLEDLEKYGRRWEKQQDLDSRYAPPLPAEKMHVPGAAYTGGVNKLKVAAVESMEKEQES